MVGRVILAILCHSAYLNIFTVLLNAPAGVVAPLTSMGKGAETIAGHAPGAFDSTLSGSRSVDTSLGQASAITDNSEHIYNDVKASDEDALFDLVKARDGSVDSYRGSINRHGRGKMSRTPLPPDWPLEAVANLETAYREHQLESRWFLPLRLYRMIFKREQWKQDQLYLKLKNLRQTISSAEVVNPPEARLAIKRLSILEYKGFDFSKEEGQLIEDLSKQVKSMGIKSSEQARSIGASEDGIRFELSGKDIELINNIAWKEVVGNKAGEITSQMNRFLRAEIDSDAWHIFQALGNMKSIMSYDTARWSPETSRLLETIKNMKTDEGNPRLLLDKKARKTMEDLRSIGNRIVAEKTPKEPPAAVDSPTSQAPEDAKNGEDLESRSEPSHSQ
ncbi:hypothetical protein H4Q26_017296 [Puccinia striiformis f. sp. tritici PST-130]|uniref:Uncharacterized protein n=1 Tax=Puccinia striiformis f. sp. tritici PST-78 TaxID=1165861 RepID=A0A0L0V809_9BASI|nr:hypothetical protein Pst134EB_018335 [Puccinia striiformis f. sp. tritici]KAH9450828.1 hypothetical protein Pst134EB_018339 [Puccinia striiformis f. sp. tritici]KAI9627612.1 hypothetical protein H4Q26_017296 [Puccinia striiformis f. sp. tritici PST-130]KNE95412.1 hypothetical protein PSTG_11265 [Puccinia striiformis f. sp. tritici PST-78]